MPKFYVHLLANCNVTFCVEADNEAAAVNRAINVTQLELHTDEIRLVGTPEFEGFSENRGMSIEEDPELAERLQLYGLTDDDFIPGLSAVEEVADAD